MKKNGYLRRFLALFLALVMIMADSSVTTFAATVGRVKQKSAAAETENQQTVYTYEDSKVTVTATLENADAVPDNAKFVVTKMNKADHQDGYAYAEQKLKEYEELENVLYDSYLIYDMHFEDENGNEIEPAESQVSVNISYKKAQKLSNETTEDSVQVLHLDENLDQLEDVTDNVELNKKGKIKEVTLTTDSFSTFIIADQGLSSFKLRLQFVDSQGNVATSQNGTYYAKIEKDGLHQFKKITVENGIGEATFDALYDNNGNRQKSIETGEYKAVLAIARPDQNPNVEGQKQNNWDTNNALSEVDNGQTFDYQFTIAINDRYTVDSSHDTVVINATQMGNNSISYADIKDGLKDASQFMVVANYFEQSMHFEGNFAVDKFKGNGNPVGAQGTEKKINLTINIEKSVNPAAAKTFNFRIVDANKNKVADVTITTDANGVGSTSYTIKDAKSAYEVYELDEKGNILEDGGKIGDYTVSYDYSEGLKGLMNYDTTSFAKVIEGVTSLTANSSNNLFVTTSEVTTDKGAVKKVTAAEFDSLINITNILTTVSGLSKKLAKAKSTDSAQVVYLTPSDLKQYRLNLPAVRDNQALVINVMIPSGMNELDVATEVLYVGNEIVDVAGKKESELDPNSKGQQIAKRTIWNFVNEDGTPYKGYVKDTGKKMGGFALVPEGSYMNNNGMCSIYAKNVYQGGAEIHKNSFPGDQEKSGTVKISNRKDTPEETSVSVKKVWNDSNNQDGIRPDSVTVQLYADGKASGAPVDLNAANNWSHTWSGLAKKANKTDIKYTVDEVSVPADYTKTVSTNEAKTEYVITNTHVTETTEATVKKVWNDSNDQDGKRPAELTVNLMNGNTVVRTVTLNAGNNWTAKVTGLAKKANGTDIAYSWSEGSMPTGYSLTDTSVDGTVTTLTNTYAPEETSVSVRKVWDDSSNQDGIRPASVTVQLYADGTASGAPVDLNAANNWSHTWTKLAKKANKTDIEYTVDEVSVPEGYTKTVSANEAKTEYVITNTHVTETTEATVKKVWNDSNDQDGKRPAKLTVNLMNGNTVVSTVTLSEENGWEATVSNLPKKENGTVISYSWSEGSMPEGYSLEGSVTSGTVTTLTNKYAPEETSVSVRKVWTDSDNQDGIRPDSITVQLKADGKESGEPVELNEANNWTHTWNGLAKKASGTEIEYSVDEVSVPGGYTKTVTANENKTEYTITNTHETEKTEATVKKVWNDSNNQDGTRPVELTVNLMNGNAVVDTVTLKEANDWSATVGNLEKKAGGKDIEYTWTEGSMPEGYKLTDTRKNGTVTTLTNTYAPEKVSITGIKTWNDANNQDGKRPTSIKISLFANGNVVKSLDVTAATNWTYSFTDLPKYEAGTEIKYTVGEEAVADYETKVEGYNITNTHKPETLDITGTKTWNDSNNQDGKRPKSITVNLLANGIITDTKTVTADDNWTYSFTDLPKYANGQEITYTVSELTVPGYTTTIDDNYNITNSYTPGETSASVTKIWDDADNQDGIRPESITVNLFADGTKLKSQSVSTDADGNWSYSFTDLPKYANGQEITYTVTEDAVDGYTTESDGYNFINIHQPETTEITGTKTWNDANNQDGKRPESITVILLANGTEKTRQAVTADEAGNWTYTFKDLPKYANGQEITYTVAEEEVTDYTTTYDGSNITNSYTPGKTSATVTKIWNDAENQDGKRPESITVSLLADGKETGKTVTLSVENNWKQTISDLPEKADGKAIEYTWTEEALPEGYELTDNSKNGTVTTLTNTYVPETTSISGTKTWDDADNQDGKRPESIIVNLLANGEIAASQTVKADEAGNWTYTFKELPKYANGKEITYTVTEEAVEGYETSVDGFNITNTYTTETTEVKGSKTWNDADNQDGKRPESITVRLLANGEEKDSQTVTADENGNWTYSFEKLPKYEAGKEIVYTVTEDAVADYTTEITGYDITNSYAPEKTSVTVTKSWADNDDRGGHRPKEIKVQLKADGENSGEEITLNAENNWTYTWSDLDQKKAGKDIAYTVEETGKAAGYISTVTGNAEEGFIITNTITSVKISKVDITDQKELAGAHIQVIDKDGNVVEEWDSTWEAHEVTGLKPGETYTLRETVAPEGYTLTSDTTFTLKEDGTVNKDTTTTTISDNGTLLVEDSRTSVKVSKVDISDGEELEGAHIQIIDQDGNVVDEWDSTKEAHVTEKLKTGKIYTLRETVAPDGYLLTSDTTFVLKEDGTVDAEKTTAVSKDGVLLVQDKLATSASIAVTKKLTYIGESLAARDQTFYVALYSDKECTQRVSDVKALEFKNADASTVVFSENIKAGKTYYIAECTQDGISQTIGALADGTVYEAVFGNGNSTTVTEADGTTTVSFENVFSSFPPDGFYKQGQLTITKKVLGADGGTRNSNEVFYAGIFDDAAHTQLSQQVEQNIIKLDMDGGYEVSEIINVGLAQSGAKVTLYVTETDSNGKPIAGSEGFGYKVTVSADSVIFDETNMTAEVVITNQEESTVTETPTPTPSSDGGNSGGSENHSGGYGGGKSPKTGDDTPIGTYLMLLLAAAMLAAETERRRRRNKRQ